MKGYFNVLESVDLGTDVNPVVRLFHKIWENFKTKSYWNPESEEERAILRGFQIWDRYCKDFTILFCSDLNAVEVFDNYGMASDFEDYTKEKLKPYFDYAYPIFLEQRQPEKKKNKKTA
jgi:hypothetical protein